MKIKLLQKNKKTTTFPKNQKYTMDTFSFVSPGTIRIDFIHTYHLVSWLKPSDIYYYKFKQLDSHYQDSFEMKRRLS